MQATNPHSQAPCRRVSCLEPMHSIGLSIVETTRRQTVVHFDAQHEQRSRTSCATKCAIVWRGRVWRRGVHIHERGCRWGSSRFHFRRCADEGRCSRCHLAWGTRKFVRRNRLTLHASSARLYSGVHFTVLRHSSGPAVCLGTRAYASASPSAQPREKAVAACVSLCGTPFPSCNIVPVAEQATPAPASQALENKTNAACLILRHAAALSIAETEVEALYRNRPDRAHGHPRVLAGRLSPSSPPAVRTHRPLRPLPNPTLPHSELPAPSLDAMVASVRSLRRANSRAPRLRTASPLSLHSPITS